MRVERSFKLLRVYQRILKWRKDGLLYYHVGVMRHLLSLLFLVLMVGCAATDATSSPPRSDAATATTSAKPTVAKIVVPRTPAPTLSASRPRIGVWRSIWPGAEVIETEDGVYALRHGPRDASYAYRFEGDPARGDFLSGWLEKTPQARAGVNCGFYWDDDGVYRHIGLLTTNGTVESRMRSRWGGAFIVRDGKAFVAHKPRKLLAPAALGVQGWPMLLEESAIAPDLDAETRARRTAVGVDGAGRVVWAVAPIETTLYGWARRLLEPDLALVEAVNLDGGASSGLRWREPGGGQQGPDSLPIPCVILLAPAG